MIQGDRWSELERVFHAAMALAPEARVAFVRQQCSGDAELAREVESLLQHEGNELSQKLRLSRVLGSTPMTPGGDGGILASLGEGGMGEVWKADRWQQIEKLYEAAAVLPPGQRHAVLSGAHADIRKEVERMLGDVTGFLDVQVPGLGSLKDLDSTHIAPGNAPIAPGANLGPYRIEAAIGQGGMGQVFRAIDTRLNRTVAIKTSLTPFDPRFQREARAIATLNHPNICTLYDVGPNYLVMELCEGQTLDSRIKRGKLPIEETLRTGSQIAAALAAAHAKGIIHRDLKPANIICTKQGAKVLDFGLAKSDSDATLTQTNAVMGTPAYMAPEQREGKETDHRTDIYALGLVLAEMATGKRPAQTGLGSLASLPAQFTHVVERCLAQEAEDRWQSASDIRKELEWLAAKPIDAAAPEPTRFSRFRWIAAVLTLAAAGSSLTYYTWTRVPPPSPLPVPNQVTLSFDSLLDPDQFSGGPRPSPDGRFLAFVSKGAGGKGILCVRPMNATAVRTILGAEGLGSIFWSPDSRWIGFFVGGNLKKVSPDGGPPQSIATISTSMQEPVWGSRGDILYRPSNREPLFRISDTGGSPVPVTKLDKERSENSHRGQQFLPDGRRFLFVARCGDSSNNALYLGSLDTGKVKRLMPIDSRAVYINQGSAASGLIVYHRDGALVSRQFDTDRDELLGDPFTVFEHVAHNPIGMSLGFRSSNDGALAVLDPLGGSMKELAWYSRSGIRQSSVGEPSSSRVHARISPDGSRMVYASMDPKTGNRDLFIMDAARGIPARITQNAANDWLPVWSPDGQKLLFGSDRNGGPVVLTFLKSATNIDAPEIAMGSGPNPEDWSRDGRWMGGFEGHDLWIAEAKPGAKVRKLVRNPQGGAMGLRFSPDGAWITYVSSETGVPEVFVRAFKDGIASMESSQISRGGGDFPIWSPDGTELFFVSHDSILWSYRTRQLGQPASPEPTLLFHLCESTSLGNPPLRSYTYSTPYDTHDGKRFLVSCALAPSNEFTILLNWPFTTRKP